MARKRLWNGELAPWLVPALCVPCLIWPALWNGYPIVFADTGTYLSQAMHRYLGWDRPVFYSFFIWPLHQGVTTWPVIVVQSGLTVLVLELTRRALDVSLWWLPGLTVFLSLATWLPWTVSEVMPDLFTPLTVLSLSLLLFAAPRFRRWERMALTYLTAFMIATQQSSVPLAFALLAVSLPLRWLAGFDAGAAGGVRRAGAGPRGYRAGAGQHRRVWPCRVVAVRQRVRAGAGHIRRSRNDRVAPRLPGAGLAAVSVPRSLPGHGGRVPLGQIQSRLCWRAATRRSPATPMRSSATPSAPSRAGCSPPPGTIRSSNWVVSRAATGCAVGTDRPARGSTGTFPSPNAMRSMRRASNWVSWPCRRALALTHRAAALGGIAAALLLLPLAWRRRHVAAWFLMAALVALPLSAAVTGGLSAPHDRYQSRIVWLPACIAFLSVPALWPLSRRAARRWRFPGRRGPA